MKTIKICLAIIVVLLVLGIGIGVYVWYTIQHVPTAADIPNLQQRAEVQTERSTVATPDVTEDIAPIVIETDTLSDTQQSMLETMGYTKDTVTITPAMIACAEDAVGGARLKEITGGAAPSPLESVKLLPCFKQQ